MRIPRLVLAVPAAGYALLVACGGRYDPADETLGVTDDILGVPLDDVLVNEGHQVRS